MSNGGRRDGAGRKPICAALKRVPVCIKLDPRVVEFLRHKGAYGNWIETLIRTSEPYREWLKERDR